MRNREETKRSVATSPHKSGAGTGLLRKTRFVVSA